MNKTIVLAFVVAACGGSPKPSPATPEPASPAAAPAEPAPEAAAPEAAAPEAAAPAPTAPAPAEPPATSSSAPPAPPERPAPTPSRPPPRDPDTTRAALLAAETAAFEKAKPVFDKFCARCHVKGAKAATAKKLEHFDMTTYPFGGEHASEMSKEMREVLAIGGGKPTMPFDKRGAVKGNDLALIAAWADAFDAAHRAGAHDGRAGHKH
jgi:hypothetical protein